MNYKVRITFNDGESQPIEYMTSEDSPIDCSVFEHLSNVSEITFFSQSTSHGFWKPIISVHSFRI